MVDPGLWQQPTLRAALARRDIGAVYRALVESGVSQRRIAQLTGQSQSEVSEVLRGRRVCGYDVLARIADGLGVPRGCLGLAYDPEPDGQPEPEPEPAKRDNTLRYAAKVVTGTEVFGPAEPPRARREPTPLPNRIGLSDVSRIEATTARLRGLGHAHGPAPAVATAHARSAEAFLGVDMRDDVRRRLLVALADAHDEADWMAGDTGQRDLARRHFDRGMRCAGAAGDKAWALATLYGEGRMELHYGQPNDALKLFQLGLMAAGDLRSALARSLFEANCAWALAKLGLADEASAALSRARDFHQATGDEEPACLRFFSRQHLLAMCGWAPFALDRWEPAATELAAAMAGDWPTTEASLPIGDLAAAQLRYGDINGGLRTGVRALEIAARVSSVRILDQLAPLQEAAADRRDPACRDLAHDIAMLRRGVNSAAAPGSG